MGVLDQFAGPLVVIAGPLDDWRVKFRDWWKVQAGVLSRVCFDGDGT